MKYKTDNQEKNKEKVEPYMMNLHQAAKYLGYGYLFMWRKAHKGEIEAKKVGKNIKFLVSDLKAWADKQPSLTGKKKKDD